jgi:predicted glycoside hydrolase/deacetylase ChbG (UPF0249 family)
MLANSPFIEEACERASLFPDCSFGAHLNLTQFPPLTGSGRLEPLLDHEGAFVEERIREISIDSLLSEGIFDEFCAQIDKLRSLGVKLVHIDSHHYIHTIPGVFPVLKKVQKRYQIRKVRISRNLYDSAEGISGVLKLKKAFYNFLLRHYYRTKTTDGFSDFSLFYQNAKSGKLKRRVYEVTVHPGSSYYPTDEIDLLKGPWRESLDFPVQLISYAELT